MDIIQILYLVPKIFFFKDFIYLFEREREGEGERAQREREEQTLR